MSAAVGEGEENASPATRSTGEQAGAVWRAARVALESLLGGLLIVVLVGAIFLAVVSRTSDRGVPRVFGHTFVVILSGSMTPALNPGDVVIDKTLTPRQAAHLQRGQVITFEAGPASAPTSVLITHRIYQVHQIENPTTHQLTPAYETKGDANGAPDGNLLQPTEILGQYQFRIPYAGYALNVLHNPVVFILLISSPFVLLVASEGTRRWKAAGPTRNSSGGTKS